MKKAALKNKILISVVCVFTFFTIFNLQAQSITRKVLFLGNSYTSQNNLPQITADVALSMGDNLIYDSNTPGGYKLSQHYTDAISTNKIMAGGWDYVVLQEQSQLPSFINYDEFFLAAADLCVLINQYNPCAREMFYMTWGRKNGDAVNCPTNPPVCTYMGMDSLLRLRYVEVAQSIGNSGPYGAATEVSPVGAVWRYIRQNYPAINLYQPDESHPSDAGSYAAACCFYTALFKKDPTLITYNYVLTASEAADIRNATKIIVFDSLPNWNFGNYLPIADFQYTIGAGINQVDFANKTIYADTYLWDFGDGFTSTDINPTHNYLSNGSYTITLTATNCDLWGAHQSTYQTTISFCSHTPTIFPDTLMLCPQTSGTFWTQASDTYQWFNADGNPIVGATYQSLVVHADSVDASSGIPYSVLTTNNNCSEMSQPALAQEYNIPWGGNIYNIYTIGNFIGPDTACLGDTLKIIFQGVSLYYTIQWLNNGMPIPSANNDTLVVTSSGNYQVSFFLDVCPNTVTQLPPLSYTFINCNNGIPENNIQPVISVYPNPSEDFINVIINSELVGSNYTINDILGRIIRTGKFDKEINNLKIDNMNSGVYILKIEKINTQIIKLIKK